MHTSWGGTGVPTALVGAAGGVVPLGGSASSPRFVTRLHVGPSALGSIGSFVRAMPSRLRTSTTHASPPITLLLLTLALVDVSVPSKL